MMFVARNGLQEGKPRKAEKPPQEQIDLSKQWLLRFCKPRRAINESYSSYRLKHAVEDWADTYICNGAFIQAAIELGYCHTLDKNPFFNISYPRVRTKLYIEAFDSRSLRKSS